SRRRVVDRVMAHDLPTSSPVTGSTRLSHNGFMRTALNVETADGSCPASLFVPSAGGAGPWPGVLMFMDGIGMRPTLYPIAQRIADAGYAVLLPDLFYRAGAYTAPEPKSLFTDSAVREAFRKVVQMP